MKMIRVEILMPTSGVARFEKAVSKTVGIPHVYRKEDSIVTYRLNYAIAGGTLITFEVETKQQVEIIESILVATLPGGKQADVTTIVIDKKQTLGSI